MSVLTGDWYDSTNPDKNTPGLLNSSQSGSGKKGGYIVLEFKLTAAPGNEFKYGTNSNYTDVGTFSLRIDVKNTDTEQDVLNRINQALNDSTILDFSRSTTNRDEHEFGSVTAKKKMIDVPIYGGTNAFYVQAGTEAGQHVSVRYDCLSLLELDMKETNLLTQKSSEEALGTIKNALQEISTQRADFGAYQNRLEHAYNANKNTEENTQASESVIRDTDMAKTMVSYANQNILQQVGQAILAQANQNSQNILGLLA